VRGLIASYPRSGLNWVRYCIEWFSGRPTPGRPLLQEFGLPIIHRSHDLIGDAWWGPRPWPTLYGSPYRRLLLLLRNYKEGLACEGLDDFTRMRPYLNNLQAWEGFAGDKLVVHYEDLIADFTWMGRILSFLDIDHDQAGFDLATHRARSHLAYQARRGVGPPHHPLDFSSHSRRLAPARRAEADAWFLARLGPEVYGRHLARYHEWALDYPA
jgi:hypothetical protein